MTPKIPFTLHVILIALLGLLFQEVLLQLVLPAWLPRPHVLVVILVLLGFSEHSLRGCILVFFLGVLLDLNGGNLVGPWAGAYIVSFALLSVLAQRIYVDSMIALVALVSLADFVTTLLYYGLVTFVPENYVFAGGIALPWMTIVLQSLVSGLFAPLVASFCKFSSVYSKLFSSQRGQFAHEGKGLW